VQGRQTRRRRRRHVDVTYYLTYTKGGFMFGINFIRSRKVVSHHGSAFNPASYEYIEVNPIARKIILWLGGRTDEEYQSMQWNQQVNWNSHKKAHEKLRNKLEEYGILDQIYFQIVRKTTDKLTFREVEKPRTY